MKLFVHYYSQWLPISFYTRIYTIFAVAQKLKIFGATVWGITRTSLKGNLDYLDEHRTIEHLPEMLSHCDYIVNVLPSTPNTLGLLNGNILKNCQKHGSVFINIGRGTIIKEADLLNALQQQWISGAILDVFEDEPLSAKSELWTLPQVILRYTSRLLTPIFRSYPISKLLIKYIISQVTISPHIAGVTRAQDVANFFARNYQRFIRNEELLNVVNLRDSY